MRKSVGDDPVDDDSSSSEEEVKPPEIDYVIQEYDSKIKFRTLDHVHNLIFLKNKNSILILEPIRLVYLYSFHHNDIIEDFNVAKNNSLVICSLSKLEIYKLESANMSDSQIKIKYELYKSINGELLQNLTVSPLCDVIITINKHRIIKLYDMDLNLIKTLNLIVNFIPKEVDMFPLNCFALNYDTKTLQLIKYNLEKISFVYKIRPEENENEYGIGEKPKEYEEKIISFNEKILFAKEYLKSFSMYINYPDSSIMLVLTQGLNFLILQKFYELNEKTYNLIPNLRTLLYINLSNHSPIKNDKYISFSLLYDNENPRLKSNFSEHKDLQSGFLDMDPWRNIKNKNTLNDDETEAFLNYNQENFKNISCDYILFNYQENVLLYKVDGLQSPPFNNPYVDGYTLLNLDDSYESNFTLLKAIKTFDRKYSIFFKDKYNNIRKYLLNNMGLKNEKENKIQNEQDYKTNDLINISLKETNYAFTMYKCIKNAKYNHGNRKTFILQKMENESIVILITFKLKFFKMIIFEKIDIININWIKNSNFLIFTYNKTENFYDNNPNIGIIYIYSKFLEKKFNRINQDMISKQFINIDVGQIFNKEIKEIYNIFLDNEYYTKNSEINEDSDQNYGQSILRNDTDINDTFSYNDVSTFLLIKTEEDLYHCFLKLTYNKNKTDKNEYKAEFLQNFHYNKNQFKYQENDDFWLKKKFIFNSKEIFYTTFDKKLDIISIIKLDKNNNIKKIYESISIGKLLDLIFFFNNYIIYISEFYINTYDITNRTFYRIRNDYIKEEELKSGQCNIHLSFFGVYLRLSLLNKKGIKIIRIPRNRNLNESFSFEFKYEFVLGEFNTINYSNKMVIFNETQVEILDKISNLNQSLLKYSNKNKNYKQLVLLNSNAGSLFDNDTFLDYFLSDNENIIKMILNIFCYEYKLLKFTEMKDKYQNSKLIPNYLASFDFIKKIIFDENFHSKIISDEKFNFLTFNQATDDANDNPIKIMCKKNSNISHMKYVYDLLANEATKKIDTFTKYFMLKMHYKKNDFENKNFKLSTVDLCWISLISNQSDLLDFICHGKVDSINWETMTMFNVPLWIKSDAKLKELLVEVAKNHYKQQFIDEAKNLNNSDSNKIKLRNYTENIALYLYLAGQQKMIIDYFDKEPHNEKIKKFTMRDFSIKKNRNAAHENADTLMNKKKYIYAAYFYLLSDDIRSAFDMVYEKLRDINLTVCMLRLVDSKYGNDSWKRYYSLEKIYKDLFINFGTVFRDPYLVTFGYLGQEKYDLALEYILQYDNEYSFDDNKEIFKDIDDYMSNVDILKKSFALNVFDYRMILFAKSLENVYHIKFEESNKTVQNVGNTGFDEDEWDMDNLGGRDDEDEDEEDTNVNTNTNTETQNDKKDDGEYKLKKIDINYDNLIKLCLINSLKQGTIYTPIINLYKTTHKDKIKDLPQSIKDILKSLICDRVVLDTINSPSKVSIVESFFAETEMFFDYLEKEGVNPKINLYKEINYKYGLMHEFTNAYQTAIKSNQVIEILLSIIDYVELIISNNIYIIVNFNYFQNVNLEKIEKNLDKIIILLNFLRKYEQNYTEPKNEKELLFDIEKNVYVFRIIFMVYFYLLFVEKILLKYHYVTDIYINLNKIVNENYYDLGNFIKDKVIFYIDDILRLIVKIKIKILGEIKKKKPIFFDEGISLYINFMNYSILKEIANYVNKNEKLKSISFSELKQISNKNSGKNHTKEKNAFNKEENDHYFYENFKFMNLLNTLVNSYLDNFDINIEKYISLYMTCDLRYSIHEELKKVYTRKSPIKFSKSEKNIKIIKYEYLFSKKSEEKFFERFNNFENIFHLGDIIGKYITFLSEKFKYEKKLENDPLEINVNFADPSLPPSNYTISSINIVSSIFHKVGYEIFNLSENLTINDFCCNNCDMTQMAVSFGSQGNIKINFLNNLLNKKKTDSMLSLMEKDALENWEPTYKESYTADYFSLLEKQIQEGYNEILSILYHGIYLPRKTFTQFPQFLRLPPKHFNSLLSSEYLVNISKYQSLAQPTINANANTQGQQNPNAPQEIVYSKVLLPHPQLPIYLSSNNRGVISVYSFSPYKDVNCPIDEYYIEKNSSLEQKQPHAINKMKFNSYGDNLLCNDSDGSVYTWNFDHANTRKIPKNIIQQVSGQFCSDDCCFLNNTGIIATTSHKVEERPKTCLFDLLLPQKQRKINEISIGGDRILPISSDASFIIANDTKPGNISFIDIRKMEVVNSFQAYQNGYIKDIKVSPNENFLVTYGDDVFVKIWDLSNKTSPLLIESFQPFEGKSEKRPKNKLQLINGFLFASKDNSIKLLRNNII